MMGLEMIRAANEEAARKCKQKGILPHRIDCKGDIEAIRHIPHIGDYRPTGFVLVNEFFVDSSGVGVVGEPALTFGEFVDVITPGRYYAIIEAGQFQVRIAEFEGE